MDDYGVPKNILRTQVYKRGRPSIRWLDDALENLRRVDVRVYAQVATDRRLWRGLLLEAKANRGL